MKTNSHNNHFTIKELSNRLGVVIKTIKTWEEKGKIPKAKRNKVGWREYTETDLNKTIKIVVDNEYFVKKV